MATARPSETEHYRKRAEALEREVAFLRRVDATMRARLSRAVEDSDRLNKTNKAQIDTITDLRRQLSDRTLEIDLLRADLEAEKAMRPPKAIEPPPSETRWNKLDID